MRISDWSSDVCSSDLLVMAAPNGFGLETFPNKARDPLWDELYTKRPEIRDGMVHFTDDPGFGFEIDWKTVERYRADRKSVVRGKRVSVRVALVGRRIIKKTNQSTDHHAKRY